MFRNVLWMIVALAGLGLAGCGEDAAPGGGDGGGTEGEGEGSTLPGEGENPAGEGEGSSNEGEGATGEGEGDGALPPGADGEPCGGPTRRECQDGYECLSCDEADVESLASGDPCDDKVCTCPQWFGGTWWAEFTDIRRTDGQEYDFGPGDPNWPFWSDQEVTFTQDGCHLKGPDGFLLWDASGNGMIDQPPQGFFYEISWNIGDGMAHQLRSRGTISPDRNTITGTCEGEYHGRPGTPELFPITCAFTLTRR